MEDPMSLFFVEHRHGPQTCPAADPQMAPMLLTHLSEQNASQHGVDIQGEAVIDGAHTLVLIVEAPDEGAVRDYMAPFAMAGSVDVRPANRCEVVVARAAC
jgi:hypothetical protein